MARYEDIPRNEVADKVELRVKVKNRVFPRVHDGIAFCSYGVVPVNYEGETQLTYTKFNSITITGTIFPLEIGEEYDVIIEGAYMNKNPQYEDFYKIIRVKEETLNTVSSQQKFLQTILTPYQAEILINAYPSDMIVDLILEDKIDLTRLKGIGKATLIKIKDKIIDKRETAELLNELAKFNLSQKKIQNIIDFYETPENALFNIRESLYNLCDISGFGFLTVDGYALLEGEDPRSLKRIQACFKYLLNKESANGHTWMKTLEAIKEVSDLTKLDEKLLTGYLDSLSSDESIKFLDDRITLSRLYEDELDVFKHLDRINNAYKPINNFNMFSAIEKAESELNVKYTDEQKEAITQAMGSGIFILNGKAGSGKTTIVKGMVEVFKTLNLTYAGTALSGKAANILSKNGIPSMTIHRLLKASGYNRFEHHFGKKLPLDVVILDEASMVNAGLFKSLIQSIKSGAKLIIVGDSGQLAGIGHGDILRDLLATDRYKNFELNQIHRQAQDSGIIELASKFRDGEQVVQYNGNKEQMTFGKNNDMVLLNYSDKNEVANDILHIISSYKNKIITDKDLMEFQILVANKDRGDISVRALNLYAQTVFNDMNKPFIKFGGYEYREGDKVIAQGNSYEVALYDEIEDYFEQKKNIAMDQRIHDVIAAYHGEELSDEIEGNKVYRGKVVDVFNGTMGIIKAIDEDNGLLFIKFERLNGYVAIGLTELHTIDMGYAMSVHKCVSPNTFIFTDKGIMSIKESFKYKYNEIEIHNGRSKKKPLEQIQYTNEDTIIIRTKRGFELEGTLDHRLLTFDEHGNFIPITLNEITDNTPLVIRKDSGIFGNIIQIPDEYFNRNKLDVRSKIYNRPTILDENMSLFLGMLVADGTVYKKGFNYAKRYEECVQLFRDLVNKLFHYDKGKIFFTPEKAYKIEITSDDLCDYINHFDGVQPKNKLVPSIIMQSTESNQCAFLKGLFEDGTVNLKKGKFDHIELSLKGKKMIQQVQMMLLNMGIVSSIVKRNSENEQWSLYIYRTDAKLFANKIGFISKFKKERLKLAFNEPKVQSSKISFPNLNKRILKICLDNNISLKMHERSSLRDTNQISNVLLDKLLNKFKEKSITNSFTKHLDFLLDNCVVDYVTKIEKSKSDVFCYHMPEGNTFIQNGIYGMNSQGSSIPNVVGALDMSAFMLLSKQLAYTLITRASEKCVLLVQNNALYKAIDTDASGNRRTFLQEFIRDADKITNEYEGEENDPQPLKYDDEHSFEQEWNISYYDAPDDVSKYFE